MTVMLHPRHGGDPTGAGVRAFFRPAAQPVERPRDDLCGRRLGRRCAFLQQYLRTFYRFNSWLLPPRLSCHAKTKSCKRGVWLACARSTYASRIGAGRREPSRRGSVTDSARVASELVKKSTALGISSSGGAPIFFQHTLRFLRSGGKPGPGSGPVWRAEDAARPPFARDDFFTSSQTRRLKLFRGSITYGGDGGRMGLRFYTAAERLDSAQSQAIATRRRSNTKGLTFVGSLIR
jgi:hypothetical protein